MNHVVHFMANLGKNTKKAMNTGIMRLTNNPTQPRICSSVALPTPSSTPTETPAIMLTAPMNVKAYMLPK